MDVCPRPSMSSCAGRDCSGPIPHSKSPKRIRYATQIKSLCLTKSCHEDISST
jgi:hypothetical protein